MRQDNEKRKTRCPRSWLFSSRGISLVEMMVAIFLFGLGALVVLTMSTTSFRTNDQARIIDCGTNLGRATMDWLLSLNYNSVSLNDTNLDGPAGLLNIDNAADYDYTYMTYPFTDTTIYNSTIDVCFDFNRHHVFWNVADNSPLAGLKTISVIVNKQTQQGWKQTVFQTMISEGN